MIQLNDIQAFGYGLSLYSPDILVEFLKAENCKARKLCSYFDKHKDVYYKAISTGVLLPVYRICAFKYAIFISINETDIAPPDGWEQVFKYDDFFIQVGSSNKLCWMSFDDMEENKESVDKRATTDCRIIPHGSKLIMLPVYFAVDIDIPQGNYRFDLTGYKRVVSLDESLQENYGRNYAYGYAFRSTDITDNENMDKDNEKLQYDIHNFLRAK